MQTDKQTHKLYKQITHKCNTKTHKMKDQTNLERIHTPPHTKSGNFQTNIKLIRLQIYKPYTDIHATWESYVAHTKTHTHISHCMGASTQTHTLKTHTQFYIK